MEALTARLEAAPGTTVAIDLPAQRVRCDELECGFEIDPFSKQCLLEGTDDIDLTLAHTDEIAAFEARHHHEVPWSVPPRGR